MRIIRITTNYPTYLNQFYEQRPGLAEQSYESQYAALMEDCFGWADFWTHALRQFGYDMWEPVGNALPMQQVWAREHGMRYKHPLYDIIAAQITHFQPTILFVDDYHMFTFDFLQEVKQRCPSIKLTLGWCGAPYHDASVFHAYDVVLSNIPELVTEFRRQGHTAEHLHHAFGKRVLQKVSPKAQPAIDFSFIGSLNMSNQFHQEREALLNQLLETHDIEIFSEIAQPNPRKIRLQQLIYDGVQHLKGRSLAEPIIRHLPKLKQYLALSDRPDLSQYPSPNIVEHAHAPVFGLRMYETLRRSKIMLNTHIGVSRQSASNMRLFEATGMGTCLLTDWKPTLSQLFEPEREVVTYRSVEECQEKARWLFENPKNRIEIGLAGQTRTLREHTFEKRAIEFDAITQRYV